MGKMGDMANIIEALPDIMKVLAKLDPKQMGDEGQRVLAPFLVEAQRITDGITSLNTNLEALITELRINNGKG